MKTVAADEAQARFGQLLAEVEGGATIEIVADGVPVARLVPLKGRRPRDANDVVERIRAFRRREKLSLGGVSIRELVDEGRRS